MSAFYYLSKLVGLGFRKLSVGQQSKGKDKLSVPNIKVWSTFSKVVGVGNAHKCFMLSQILIAKWLAVWRLEHNGESIKIAIATKEKARY
ncbi:hypothetical protein [Ruminococcus sp.]|uniref:hypothetical protein n=1 Tax=Ruminococcus sp. TaxID=41978 RepID=UPI003A8E19ED